MKKKIGFLAVALLLLLSTAGVVSASDCYAWTYCPNLGTSIWCRANNGPFGICSWNVVPYSSVTCTGHDAYGYWRTFSASCY